jgi:divinyl chlorophyllide a 8-vinyl-reductase
VSTPAAAAPKRVLLLGASGTIGRATARALAARGHAVVGVVRAAARVLAIAGCEWRRADVADVASLTRDGLRGERFDAVLSCLASRTGAPDDAWAIDRRAHLQALQMAQAAGIGRWLQLSAICLQKPQLEFQHAKLAFEAELRASSLQWTLVRPTAFFKSLSGQVQRVRAGRPFMVFGDGRLTACKPIADEDLAEYLAEQLVDAGSIGQVLPIGGPGPAITPRDQAEILFGLLGRPLRLRSVPPALMDAICGGLHAASKLWPPLQAKAEFARIGRYYARESMLVWDAAAGRYDADATPSTGTLTLADHYAALLRGEAMHERGEHAVF